MQFLNYSKAMILINTHFLVAQTSTENKRTKIKSGEMNSFKTLYWNYFVRQKRKKMAIYTKMKVAFPGFSLNL